jgi:hypothetical protein
MQHPLTYLSSILEDIHQRPEFCLDLYNPNNIDLTLETKGLIPNRWIRMLADFGLENATLMSRSIIGPI